jgi:hypothetical protein
MTQLDKLLTIEKLRFDTEIDLISVDDKISLIYPLNSKIITKEEHLKLTMPQILTTTSNANITTENNANFNKKRTSSEMLNNSSLNSSIINIEKPNLNYNKPKIIKRVMDPERKALIVWSSAKLEEEVKKLSLKVEELQNIEKDIGKKQKEIQRFKRLTDKWLKISQDAAYQLLDLFPQNKNYEKNTIKHVIEHFKIDKELIEYDEENECFK